MIKIILTFISIYILTFLGITLIVYFIDGNADKIFTLERVQIRLFFSLFIPIKFTYLIYKKES